MNLQDRHSILMKKNLKAFFYPVVLIEPDGSTEHHDLYPSWNAVEHGLRIDNLEAPIGEKLSVFFDRDQLSIAGIVPTRGWTLRGRPNKYVTEKTYLLEIPKKDDQLPSNLFFLSEIKPTDTKWEEIQ